MKASPTARLAPAIVALVALAACSGGAEPPAATPAATASSAGQTWQCEDGRVVQAAFDPGGRRATVTVDDERHELPIQPAASGARYADGAAEFWTKGNEALLFADGRSTTCVSEG